MKAFLRDCAIVSAFFVTGYAVAELSSGRDIHWQSPHKWITIDIPAKEASKAFHKLKIEEDENDDSETYTK